MRDVDEWMGGCLLARGIGRWEDGQLGTEVDGCLSRRRGGRMAKKSDVFIGVNG